MDMEAYARRLMQGENGASLQRLMGSDAGAALSKHVDGEKLQRAAQDGDMQALSAMLKTVLGTPEGKRFADEVLRAVNGDGR